MLDGIAAENMEVQGEDDVSTLDEEVDTIVDTEPVQEGTVFAITNL